MSSINNFLLIKTLSTGDRDKNGKIKRKRENKKRRIVSKY